MDYSSDRSIMCCRIDAYRNVWAAKLDLLQTLPNNSQQHSTDMQQSVQTVAICSIQPYGSCMLANNVAFARGSIVTWYACGLFRGMTCVDFMGHKLFTITKSFPKTQLESKWKTTFWVVPAEFSGSNGTSEKVVLFFRAEYSKRKFGFQFFMFQSTLRSTSFWPSRSFSWYKW